MLARSIAVALLTVFGLASLAAAERPDLFAEGPFTSVPCDSPGTGVSLPFETKAEAVLITVTLNVEIRPDSTFQLRPTIDGVALSGPDGAIVHHTGSNTFAPYQTTLSSSRAHGISRGLHTYGLELDCFGPGAAQSPVQRAWMTVTPIR